MVSLVGVNGCQKEDTTIQTTRSEIGITLILREGAQVTAREQGLLSWPADLAGLDNARLQK